jgi:hypothetical protein
MAFGKATFGGNKKRFKLEDGDNVYGILPPNGTLSESGKWFVYYAIEWGFKNSKGQNKPFQDVRVVNFKTKMVEVESAAHLHREQLNAQKKAMQDYITQIKPFVANGQVTKEQEAQALKQLKDLDDLLGQYNLEKKYYLNVINLHGEIGLLKVGYKAFQSLKDAIAIFQKTGQSAIGLKGVYFNFRKSCPSGIKRDTTTVATVYKENIQAVINGQTVIVQQDKMYDLNPIIERAQTEAWELGNMYPKITPEQVEQIVKGTAADVDAILGTDNKEDKQEFTQAPTLGAPAMPTMPSMPTMPTVTQAIPASIAATNVQETTQVPQAPQMPTAPVTVAPTMPTAPVVNTAPATTPVVPKAPALIIDPNCSNEDFIKSLMVPVSK